jgi:hypothetical protein
MNRRRLTVGQVLAWSDAYRRRTGVWPGTASGPIQGGPAGETWRRIDNALRYGLRGLKGGSSLAQLLDHERGVPARRGRKRSGRAQQALRLRRQGLTLKEVGRRLGVTWQAIWQMLRRLARDEGTGPARAARADGPTTNGSDGAHALQDHLARIGDLAADCGLRLKRLRGGHGSLDLSPLLAAADAALGRLQVLQDALPAAHAAGTVETGGAGP